MVIVQSVNWLIIVMAAVLGLFTLLLLLTLHLTGAIAGKRIQVMREQLISASFGLKKYVRAFQKRA